MKADVHSKHSFHNTGVVVKKVEEVASKNDLVGNNNQSSWLNPFCSETN